MVAPYSGDMLEIVARSGSDREESPGPWNSTNLPTTPFARSIWVTVSTRSVAVAPAGSRPESRNPTTSGTSMETGRPRSAAAASLPLPPPQGRVPPAVALHLASHVRPEGSFRPEPVHLDGVVDDQVRGHERVDLPGVAPHPAGGVAHGGEVAQGRTPGEILKQHAGGAKRDLPVRGGARFPAGQRLDVLGTNGRTVLVAQQVLQKHLEGERQARDRPHAPFLESVQAKDLVAPSSDGLPRLGAETAGRLLSHGLLRLQVIKKMVPRRRLPVPGCLHPRRAGGGPRGDGGPTIPCGWRSRRSLTAREPIRAGR